LLCVFCDTRIATTGSGDLDLLDLYGDLDLCGDLDVRWALYEDGLGS
jgi:hypothetical protein